MHKLLAVLSVVVTVGCSGLSAQEGNMTATMQRVTATGTEGSVGTMTFRESEHGLIIEPNLTGLKPGPLGAHVHQNPNCGPGTDGTPAGAAGTHIDPATTGKHEGPYAKGHTGDTPNLMVEQDGSVKVPVLAPRLKLADLTGRSFMIHAAKDDYGQQPGGARMLCGVIK